MQRKKRSPTSHSLLRMVYWSRRNFDTKQVPCLRMSPNPEVRRPRQKEQPSQLFLGAPISAHDAEVEHNPRLLRPSRETASELPHLASNAWANTSKGGEVCEVSALQSGLKGADCQNRNSKTLGCIAKLQKSDHWGVVLQKIRPLQKFRPLGSGLAKTGLASSLAFSWTTCGANAGSPCNLLRDLMSDSDNVSDQFPTTCWCSLGNEGMYPGIPLKEIQGMVCKGHSISHSLPIAPARQGVPKQGTLGVVF